MYERHLQPRIETALADTPVVLVNGPRQAGKSTLVRRLADASGVPYLTLDDATVLASAAADPVGFLANLPAAVAIDEVQKAPALFPAMKRAVDLDRRGGRFLVTGSANVLLLPDLAESLAGRMEVVTLLPLSQGERLGRKECFVEWAFSGEPPSTLASDPDPEDLVRRVIAGGYPEVLARPEPARRTAWHEAYLSAVIQRDVRDLANIQGLTELPRLMALLAARESGLLNVSDVARNCGLPVSSIQRYLTLLETVYLIAPLPAWFVSLEKRITKAPKSHLVDSGLTAFLAGYDAQRPNVDAGCFGRLLEGFVVAELRKQLGWSVIRATAHHFRMAAGQEVDAVLEARDGRIVGIEVKASASVGPDDFRGLAFLSDSCRDRFARGIVLYRGDAIIPFRTFWALPVDSLWRIQA